MPLIIRDPDLQNRPSGYSRFRDLAKSGHKAESMGFRKPNGDVFRFANRYRLAKSFSGIQLDGYTPDTVSGYSALFKVFLAYSAFELFMELLGENLNTISSRLQRYEPKCQLDDIRHLDQNWSFVTFLRRHVNPRLKQHLDDIRNVQTNNITHLAAAVRHIFAHGHLSAHANNTTPEVVVGICDILYDFHMNFMQGEFGKCVEAYDKNMPRNG